MAAVLLMALLAQACTGSAATTTTSAAPSPASDPLVAAVGDLVCAFGTREPPHHAPADTHGQCEPEKVAALVTRGDYDAFLPLGDLQYSYASLWRFQKYWDRYYGSVKDITYPVPGNHEGYNGLFEGYFGYFGEQAHPPGGYYSFNLGSWHVIALNSQMCRNKVWGLHVHQPSDKTSTGFTRWINPIPGGGCEPGDPMIEWLRQDLATHPNSAFPCTLALFHHPMFHWTAANVRPRDLQMLTLWRVLHAADVDVALNGHDHDYQRWVPMDPTGKPDVNGMAEFIVGTGGDSYQPLPDAGEQPATVAAAQTGSYGILRLVLHPGSYDFSFVTAADQPAYDDAGTASCT